jgi:hypothetical protein
VHPVATGAATLIALMLIVAVAVAVAIGWVLVRRDMAKRSRDK